MNKFKNPNDALKTHVSGAIERGEAVAIEAVVKPKHTPGPWTKKGLGVSTVSDDYNNVMGIANIVGLHDSEEDHANARLIAAAPELLEALWGCVYMMKRLGITGKALDDAEIVLKKAQGG